MYCFRCGRKLPGREINCPDCDTPQKKRRRRHRRMILGLFIFLSGAFVGSLFDTYIFKGEAWKHSFLNEYLDTQKEQNSSANKTTTGVTVEMKYGNPASTPTSSETEKANEKSELQKNLFPSEETKYNSSAVSPASEVVEQNNENAVRSSENVEELKPAETILSEIASALASAPVIPPADAALTTANSGVSNEVTIVVGKESDFETTQTEAVVEASGTSQMFTEAAPIPETEQTVEQVQTTEQAVAPEKHLVYKNISLLETASGDSYHAFMSRDGKELLFASNRYEINGKPTFQCFIKSPSEKATPERVFEWKGNVWTPELTPDGNMIIFSSDSIQKEHIFLYDRKSGHSMALTAGNSKNMMPCISPDGKKIVFVSNRGDGKNRIWMLEIFNKNKITQITKGAVNDCEPRWTPDGKNVVFTRIINPKKVSHIMKVCVEPVGEPVAIVSANSRNWMADVSPDNRYLAYTRSLSADGNKNTIVLQDLSSGKEEILNFSEISESKRPVWNSDGSGLVFHANKKSIKSLYQANFVRE